MQDGKNRCRLYLIKPSAKDSFHFGGTCAAKKNETSYNAAEK